MSFVFLLDMSYSPTYFINCDKEDLETCYVKLLTQPQSFQTETLAILLCYLPYLFSALMSQTGFFLLFQTPEKSTPLPTATSRMAGAVAGLRETAWVHAQAALAMLPSILKELRSSMKDTVEFWSRVPYFWDFLLHYFKIIWEGGRVPPPGIEIFILEH